MKAILTVVGKDKAGIISGISYELFNLNINILDVSQTILDEFFTMFMMLDLSKANKPFDKIKSDLSNKSVELDVSIKIQREEIFNSMHSI